MINTPKNCVFFIDFSEKFANYLNNNTNNKYYKAGLDFNDVYQNIELIFSKEEVNSLYVSSSVKNIDTNYDFLEPIFKKIIDMLFDKIIYFKNVNLIHFIDKSIFYNHFISLSEKEISKLVIKYIKFYHIHKDDFYLDSDYKSILKEIFVIVFASLDYKVDKKEMIAEVKRLQFIIVQHEDFIFLNEIIYLLRQIKTKDTFEDKVNLQKEINKYNTRKAIELTRFKELFKSFESDWFIEKNDDLINFLLYGSDSIKTPISIKIPVKYFFFLVLILIENKLIEESSVRSLIRTKTFIHIKGNLITDKIFNTNKNKFRQFDWNTKDTTQSLNCIFILNKVRGIFN